MNFVKLLLFVLGLGLLSLTAIGRFMTLRNPDIYKEEDVYFNEDIILSHEEVVQQIERLPQESVRDYALRLNKLINQGIAHYWKDKGITEYHLRVPVWENYLLYAASFIWPDTFRKYKFADYHRALERGVGLCSQHATVLTGILEENGINAVMVGLGGHVVLQAEVEPGVWYLLDPDYGVAIPHDISYIQANPELVRSYYSNIESSYRSTGITLERMVQIYGPERNDIRSPGIKGNGIKRYYIEQVSYAAIWIIPLLLLIPYTLELIRSRLARGPAKTVNAAQPRSAVVR